MQIGVIGLGRMGAGIAKRLLQADHAIVGFDMARAHVEQIVQTGAAGARSIQDLVSQCLERSEFNLDLTQIAGLWQHGAVVRSWLLDLIGRALKEEGNTLEHIADYVDDSGTGRWTVEYALKEGIPVPGISIAVYERFDSRVPKRFAYQVIAALRKQFGGHEVQEG